MIIENVLNLYELQETAAVCCLIVTDDFLFLSFLVLDKTTVSH